MLGYELIFVQKPMGSELKIDHCAAKIVLFGGKGQILGGGFLGKLDK